MLETCRSYGTINPVVTAWRYWHRCGGLLIDSDESVVVQHTADVLGFLVARTYQPQSCFAYMLQTANASLSNKAAVVWRSAIAWFEYVSAALLSNLMH